MKSIRGILIVVFLTLGLSTSCASLRVDLSLKQVNSKAELVTLLNDSDNKSSGSWYQTRDTTFAEAMSGSVSDSNDHSTTNVQVAGVDEGDIIKVDDEYIYTLTSSGLTITQASSGHLQIVYQQDFENYVPQEMFLYENQLILIGGTYEYFAYSGKTGEDAIEPALCIYPYFSYSKTNIRIYDMSDHANLLLQKEVTILGNYATSRIIDGTMYFFTNYYFYNLLDNQYIPRIADSSVNGGAEYEIGVEDIYYYSNYIYFNFFLVGKIELDQTAQVTNLKAYLGISGELYVSSSNVYVASYDNAYSSINYLGTYSYTYLTYTRISKIALSDLLLKDVCRIQGNIKDRYSLDEYNGYLRVATTISDWQDYQSTLYSNVYVLDTKLKIVGSIRKIAEGERLYSVRFQADQGVLVTFKQIDPLFQLDLSNPLQPQISQGLKEEGVSLYLHYITGTDYVIGLGYNTETTSGGRTRFNGIKISLYDHSQAEAVNLSTVVLEGEWSYSEALYNPKAILYDQSSGLFAFAAEEWAINLSGGGYYTQSRQGLYVFTFADLDLSDYHCLTNFNEGIHYNDWYDYYDNYYSYIQRGARIGDYLYTISERYICSYNLIDYQLIEQLQIGTFVPFATIYNSGD